MFDFFSSIFASNSYIPHGHCYLWQTGLVGLHVTADALIALAYYSIPFTLFYFVRKRHDLPFNWIFLLFALFITACGTTHLMGIWTLWHPHYWVSGTIKAITAFVSMLTAVQLIPLVPQALALPSPAQLEQANRDLQTQIQERLRVEHELRQYQDTLEHRVQERTAELLEANQQLQREVSQRQQTEVILRESQERLVLAQKIGKIGTFEWDIQSETLIWTEEMEALYGFRPGQFGGRYDDWLAVVHGDDQEGFAQAVHSTATNGADFMTEFRIVLPDGQVRWIVAKAQVVEDEVERSHHLLGVSMDVTALKQTEQALLQSEQRFRIAQELSLDAFTLLRSVRDETNKIVDFEWIYVNPKAADVFQQSADALIGTRLLDRLPSHKTESNLFDRYVEVVETGKPHDLEFFYNWEGISGWFRNMAVKLEDGIAVSFNDISDRKRTEAEIAALNQDLQARVDELQTLFDVVPIGILLAQDREFKTVRANPAFVQILGTPTENVSFTPTEERDRPTYKIFQNGIELSADRFPLRYAAIHGLSLEGTEVDIMRSDGAVFNLFGYAAPLFDKQGCPRGSVAAFLDITERKQLEAERERLLQQEQAARMQAEAANQIKDEFLAVLSHELRTPLNPILGWVKLLQSGRLEPEQTAIALETIERNAKLQTQLIEDLLDISRILQGKFLLNVGPVDLAAIINAAQETVRLAAEAKAIRFEFDLDTSLRRVMGDQGRLQQVVWNLLSNAIKFTPVKGVVTVTLAYTDTDAQIQVKDTGTGIQPDFLPYVFDSFRQADSKTTRQFGGLGLGLAIVRQIVELHGGTVQVASPGVNLGAIFTIRLPLSNTAIESEGSPSPGLGEECGERRFP